MTHERGLLLPAGDGSGAYSERKRRLRDEIEPRSPKRFKRNDNSDHHYYNSTMYDSQYAAETAGSSATRAPPPYDMTVADIPTSNSLPRSIVNGTGHSWMIGKSYLDAPIRLPVHEETVSNKHARRLSERNNHINQGENPALYMDRGRTYSLYSNAHLPPEDSSTIISREYDSLSQAESSPHRVATLLGEDADQAVYENRRRLPSRQLVVLDLNGSLLVRGSRNRFDHQRQAWRRPYLDCLVQYLSHERTTNAVLVEHKTKRKRYHILPSSLTQNVSSQNTGINREKRKRRRKKQSSNPKHSANGDEQRHLKFEKLRKKIRKHPDRYSLLAPLDAMVWSSVQPQNITSMIDAAFGWNQGILRACWTRCMLGLDRAGFHQKVQTTKNLERVWWSSENRYSAASTVLLDDSILKARLQPWNLLQITEYQIPIQENVSKLPPWRVMMEQKSSNSYSPSFPLQSLPPDSMEAPTKDDKDDSGSEESSEEEQDESPTEGNYDQTLLAVIGVLEELRGQNNISAWIRKGGLLAGHSRSPTGDGDIGLDKGVPLQGHDMRTGDTPSWCTDPEILSHWIMKGRKALRSRGILVQVGMIDTQEDDSLHELQTIRRR
ncbi:hypothetical protein FRC17_011270 [Serendipita sp. 399]|nr:hypothetical protein FRC17_011270 [Serendipita sp. 399]